MSYLRWRAEEGGSEKPARKVRAARLAWPLALTVLAGLLGALAFQPQLDTGGDNADYLSLARALATGRGYTAVSGPLAQPELQRYPGYPVLLAGLMLVAGERLWLLKLASLACLMGSAWLAYRLLAREPGATAWLAGAAVWLFIWNLRVLKGTTVVASEAPYLLFTLACLLAVEKTVTAREWPAGAAGEAPRQPRAKPAWLGWFLVAIVTAAAAIYVRPNGVTLIPALAIYLALRKRWGLLVAGLALGTALLTPLAVMQYRAAQSGGTYLNRINTIEQGNRDVKAHGAGDLARRTLNTALAQTRNLGQLLLAIPDAWSLQPRPVVESKTPVAARAVAPSPSVWHSPLRTLRRASRYLLGLIVLGGFLVTWRRRGSLLHWYVLMNVALLLVTPYPRGRYLMPLAPMWAWFLVAACLWLGARLWSRRGRQVGVGLVIACCLATTVFASWGVAQQAILNWQTRGQSWYSPQRYALIGSDEANYVQASVWLKQHAPVGAVIVCRKPYNTYWISGRVATWGPMWQPPALAWQQIEKLQTYGPVFVLQDGFVNRYQGDITTRHLQPALAAHQQSCRLRLALQHPPTLVWQLVGQGER